MYTNLFRSAFCVTVYLCIGFFRLFNIRVGHFQKGRLYHQRESSCCVSNSRKLSKLNSLDSLILIVHSLCHKRCILTHFIRLMKRHDKQHKYQEPVVGFFPSGVAPPETQKALIVHEPWQSRQISKHRHIKEIPYVCETKLRDKHLTNLVPAPCS